MIEKLEFLIAIARERNFRRAAEACGVAQPTLSAGIKSLEDQLGVRLVQRTSRFLGFTPEGERVLEWARRLAGDARAMRQEILSLRRGLAGELRLAVIPTALPFTPVLTQAYRALHPGVRISVLSASSNEILAQLDGLQVEAGITYLGGEAIGRLRAVPLYVERYRLLTGSGSALAKRSSVTWAEIAGEQLCLFSHDMQNRRILDRLLGAPGVDALDVMVEADTTVALLAHVRHGGLSSVVSEQVAELIEGHPAFRSIAIEDGDAAFPIGLVIHDREPLSPMLRALVELAEKRRRVNR